MLEVKLNMANRLFPIPSRRRTYMTSEHEFLVRKQQSFVFRIRFDWSDENHHPDYGILQNAHENKTKICYFSRSIAAYHGVFIYNSTMGSSNAIALIFLATIAADLAFLNGKIRDYLKRNCVEFRYSVSQSSRIFEVPIHR